jgi:conjugal transfer/type IV secretion protein DotA/TraY
METFYQTSFTAMTDAAWQEMNDSGVFAVEPELLARGWGGAGIWYNRIAQWNGAFISAVKNMPSPSALPYPMIQVQTARRGEAGNITTEDRFNPQINGDAINFEKQYERDIAVELHRVYTYWNLDPATEAADVRDNSNMFINFINMVFGLDGLFVIRENHDIHPLAQLVALGKGIVDAAVRNLVIAIGSSAIAGGMEGFSGNSVAGAAGNSLSGIFVTLATVGLTVGFILYYVLPFLPFMYFFFAVGGWVKSIFEAMVGVPLWALAHLKVDGNGLPGDLAMNGYFLVFEIFVRPILTVFGLLASLSIFTAMVRVLHEIFPLITQNMTGFSAGESTAIPTLLYTALAQNMGMEFKRDPVDEFFFTILYTIIVYLLATSSFKLIDQIPNNILRWMGAGVQSFNDRRDDPTQGLVQFAALGGSQMSGQVAGVMTQGAHGAGMVGGSVARGISDLLPSFGLTNRVTGK